MDPNVEDLYSKKAHLVRLATGDYWEPIFEKMTWPCPTGFEYEVNHYLVL
jgi:hypothetical protein